MTTSTGIVTSRARQSARNFFVFLGYIRPKERIVCASRSEDPCDKLHAIHAELTVAIEGSYFGNAGPEMIERSTQ